MGRRIHVTSEQGPSFTGRMRQHLSAAGLTVGSLTEVEPTFEDIFMSHTTQRGANHEHVA
jgi:hypothetical protein